MSNRPEANWRRTVGIATALFAAWTTLALGQASVESEDGLKLTFDAAGNVAKLSAKGMDLPTLNVPSGFFVTDVARSIRNLIPGGDFEDGEAVKKRGWEIGPSWAVVAQGGARFARAVSKTVRGSGNVRSPRVPVKSKTAYMVTARVRTASQTGQIRPGLYVVQFDAGGKLVKAPTARGESVQIGVPVPRAASTFTKVSKPFVTQPRTATVQVYANIYRSVGRYDIDDVRLEPGEMLAARFKGQATAAAKAVVFQ